MHSRTSKIIRLAMSLTDSSLTPNCLETEKDRSDPAISEPKGSPSAVITNQVDVANAEKKLEESSVSKLMDCFDQDIFEIPLDEVGISNEVEVENEGNELEESSSIKRLRCSINSPVPHTIISGLRDSLRDDFDNLETLSDDELLNLAEVCEKKLSSPKDVMDSVSAAGPCTIKTPENPYETVSIESEEVNLIHLLHKDNATNDNEDLPLNDEIDNNSQVNVPNNNRAIEDLEDSIAVVAPNRPAKKKRENVKKRVCKPETWKINRRQKMCQSGKEYISVRGKTVSAKKVVNKKDCLGACKFSCGKKIGETERKSIFELYYSFTQNEKYLFLKSTTEKYLKGRKTVDSSRRNFTFRYFFTVREERLRVCKQFFLGTLNISQKPVYTAQSVESENTPKKNLRGKTGSRKINDDTKNNVMDRISKFPVLESHYCRASSNKKYLEATLSVSKMYDLYLEHCNKNDVPNPVKLSMYRHIFNTNFNLSFHKPKKDVCERCSRYYLRKKENNLDEKEEEEMMQHMAEKTAMRTEKDQDRKSEVPVLCFDLENVITCPRSYVGNHFYLPKLSMYNLTAHLSLTNTVYCVIWVETMQGRTGNCLASV